MGDYAISSLSFPEWDEEANNAVSHFSVYLPVDFLRGDHQQFEQLVTELTSGLPVLHGYAGLGFQQCNEFHRYENLELELAEQFLGFDVGRLFGHDELSDGFKSVNWYTILDNSWMDKLRGREMLEQAVEAEAGNGLKLLDYANGVILRAGEWPSLGWVERDPLPAAYVAANRILKPARAPMLRGLHYGSILGEARFNRPLTDSWLRRFDAPGIWPPRPEGEQPDRPVMADAEPEQPPVVLQFPMSISAKPGELCPRSGRWFSHFLHEYVDVKAGEPMPGPKSDKSGNGVIWYFREDQKY